MTMVSMSSSGVEDNKVKKHSIKGDLDERPRQGNADLQIGLKDNIEEATATEASQDSRDKLIHKASKSPAEEKEEERVGDRAR